MTPEGATAIVTFMVPGSATGNKKKLINAPGAPFGRIVAEYEKSCLCAFEAVKVKEFATKQLQLLTH